jgi:sugar-specific transcriptional regulator TrmB
MAKPARLQSLKSVPSDASGQQESSFISAKVAEDLYREFEGLGLTPYQARVVVALQQVGSTNCVELGRLAGIPRTSVYQVVEELDSRGLASRLPGKGPAVWASIGRKEVLDRLIELEGERLDNLKSRALRVAETLDRVLPADRSVSPPYVQVIHDPSRVGPLYSQLLQRTEHELLMFTRPPYTRPIGGVDPVILDAARRVTARVLYQAAEAADADHENWHREMEQYHAVGVQARVVADLPIKLAIFDRQCTILSLDDPVLPQVGFPITLLIEHPGYSSVQANAFENLWSSAALYEDVHQRFESARYSDLA